VVDGQLLDAAKRCHKNSGKTRLHIRLHIMFLSTRAEQFSAGCDLCGREV
jgi:hypothetical protein